MDLRPSQQEGNLTWYWKPNQLLRTREIMDFGKEPVIAALLNQLNL